MAKKKKSIIDLKNMNISYEDKSQLIKLINFKISTMSLEIEIYESGTLLKKSTMVYAHLPKKLKVKLNPYF